LRLIHFELLILGWHLTSRLGRQPAEFGEVTGCADNRTVLRTSIRSLYSTGEISCGAAPHPTAHTGGNSYGKGLPYITSPETDGITWTNSGTQTFSDGPYDLELDAKNRILYSSNWRAGVWAMKVP
jgi:hypothetical protein